MIPQPEWSVEQFEDLYCITWHTPIYGYAQYVTKWSIENQPEIICEILTRMQRHYDNTF